jgi:hypothetical protein
VIEYTLERALREFCPADQYIDLEEADMEIVRSLAPGGGRHYAPSVPFIEEYLSRGQYGVERVRFDREHERTTVRDLGGKNQEERR